MRFRKYKTYKNTYFAVPEDVKDIIRVLLYHDYEAYLVGGAIRSAVLGQPIKDYDVCTNATPDEIQRLFNKTMLVGAAFGVVNVVSSSGRYVEVATFRTEDNYTDGRHPDVVQFTNTLKEDLSRRDFTINTLVYDLSTNSIRDYFNGMKDIKHRKIRCVGDPIKRLVQEDCLRMMRAIRFASQLGFTLDPQIYNVIANNAAHIYRVSEERIRSELNKILESKYNTTGIFLLQKLNLLQCIIPELSVCNYLPQYNPYHFGDVFTHTLAALNNLDKDLPLSVYLAVLLHDTGKPYHCTMEGGRARFNKHWCKSMEITNNVLTRLKYPSDIIKEVNTLVFYHDYELPTTVKRCKKLLNTLGSEDMVRKWFCVRTADALAHNLVDKLEYYERDLTVFPVLLQHVIELQECFSIKDLAINGNDILAHGVKEGPEVGKILNECLELVIKYPEKNNKTDLTLFLLNRQ